MAAAIIYSICATNTTGASQKTVPVIAIVAALISLTVFLLLAFLIPISMNISMEVLKTLQGDLIGHDIEMSMILPDKKNKRQYCRVQNTSIIEELGNVEYVLSDKTGTLTSNEMVFKNIWVEGTEYTADGMISDKRRLLKDANFIRFWTAVVLCH
jgi:P-type E1-E2 ATPase